MVSGEDASCVYYPSELKQLVENFSLKDVKDTYPILQVLFDSYVPSSIRIGDSLIQDALTNHQYESKRERARVYTNFK